MITRGITILGNPINVIYSLGLINWYFRHIPVGFFSEFPNSVPILDTLQAMKNSWLVNIEKSHWYQQTKGLVSTHQTNWPGKKLMSIGYHGVSICLDGINYGYEIWIPSSGVGFYVPNGSHHPTQIRGYIIFPTDMAGDWWWLVMWNQSPISLGHQYFNPVWFMMKITTLTPYLYTIYPHHISST